MTQTKRVSRVIIALFGLWLLAGSILPAAGQDNSGFVPYQRLVMLRVDPARDNSASYGMTASYGDLYSWAPGESELFRETTYGYNDAPVMSPDGSKVVYLSLPVEYVDPLLRGEKLSMGGPLPTNIWLMDLTTLPGDPARFVRIADQITGLPTDTNGTELQRRSRPVWSPDSTQIAWLELDYLSTAFSGRIMIYDTRTGITQTAARDVSLGYADAGQWDVPNLAGWGSVIAHSTSNAMVYPDLPNGGFGTLLALYTSAGNSSKQAISYFATTEDQFTELKWVMHRSEWWLALHYSQSGWIVLDPIRNTYEQLTNPPFIRAITGDGWTGQSVSFDSPQLNWQHNGMSIIDGPPGGQPQTFSPAGSPIWVMAEDGRLLTFEQYDLQPLALPTNDGWLVTAAAWTPMVWVTDGAGTITAPQVVP